jgi:hypothetical protein
MLIVLEHLYLECGSPMFADLQYGSITMGSPHVTMLFFLIVYHFDLYFVIRHNEENRTIRCVR